MDMLTQEPDATTDSSRLSTPSQANPLPPPQTLLNMPTVQVSTVHSTNQPLISLQPPTTHQYVSHRLISQKGQKYLYMYYTLVSETLCYHI